MMKKAIQKGEYFLLCNFFLIYAIAQLFLLLGLVDLHINQFFHLGLGVCGVYYLFKNNLRLFDSIILLYLFYLLLNGVLIDYDGHWQCFYRTLPIQIASIFCYFIGRFSKIEITEVLLKMKLPWICLSIIGLYCFFILPSWYIKMKTEQLGMGYTDNQYLSVFRLSSIWGHPYQITYATFFFGIYLIYDYVNKKTERYGLLFLMLCCLVLLLGQIRAAIGGLVVSLMIILLKSHKAGVGKWVKISILSFLIAIGVILILSLVDNSQLNSYIVNHMQEFLSGENMTDRLDYTSGGIKDYSLFGDGFGRYGYEARLQDRYAIVDSEYQKHLAEVGYFGFAFLLLFIVFTLIKSIKKRIHTLELCVILFYCFAMIGASTLSNPHQFGFMFWFCLGKLWANERRVFNN